MIKRDITFEDLDGNTVTETYYFHLSKSDIIELEISGGEQGLHAYIKRMIATSNAVEIMGMFKKIIGMTVGERSPDGRHFKKTPEITEAFTSSPAYDELLFELISKPDKASEFIAGVVPKGLAAKLESLPSIPEAKGLTPGTTVVDEAVDLGPQTPPEYYVKDRLGDYTEAELTSMPNYEFDAVVKKFSQGNNVPRALLIVGMRRPRL